AGEAAAHATRVIERAAAAEQRREEVREITADVEAARATACATAAREVLLPAGRRRKVLSLFPVRAELVIGLALLRIRQNLVRLVGFLEPVLGTLGLVLVGVEL